MRRPTQKDVAHKAGVSRSTVSYVLNDQTDQKIPISPETRQRVLEAIAELGYEPDARAQSLRRGNTRTVGVLFPILQNPHFWQILYGISSELQAVGYSLHLLQNPLGTAQESHHLRELAQYRVDGFIILGPSDPLSSNAIKYLHKFGRPVVELTSSQAEFDCVFRAYDQGTRVLMAHLFELGHQRIGFVYGVAGGIHGLDRLFTYRQIMQNAGLWVDGTLELHCGDTLEDGYQAAHTLLNRPDRPSALLVINDLLAIGAIRAAYDLGLRIPDDVSIASFDDIPFATYTIPRLTTISGGTEQSGRDAVRLLLKRLTEPDMPRQTIIMDVQLVVRESTGPVPASFSAAHPDPQNRPEIGER